MAVDAEMLKRIMGAPDSITGKLVALRKTPGDGELETGVWYSNFTRVKTEAERRGLPFFAMWTNGDLCGLCRRFTGNILEPSFLDKMRSSGGLWWLGGSMDDNEEDKRGGIGFRWCTGPERTVNYFPFFAVTQTVGGKTVHGFFGSGHDYDQRKQPPDGAAPTIAKIDEVLSKPYGTVVGIAPAAGGGGGCPGSAKPAAAASPVKLNTVMHIRFNPEWDAHHIARFQNALKENGGHCPCQKNKTPDTMCMCKAFLEQGTAGKCFCGAFEKYTV